MPDDKPTPAPNTCPVPMSDRIPCGRPIYDAPFGAAKERLCLMHSRTPGKDTDVFDQEIDAILNGTSTHHRPTDRYDFQEFVFPETNFSETEFDRLAHFRDATFSSYAWFTFAVFHEGASFASAKFEKECKFTYCRFLHDATFTFSAYAEDANFEFAEFHKRLNFMFARCYGSVDFSRAGFSGEASLDDIFVEKGVDFSRAVFAEDATFRNSVIHGGAHFSETMFMGVADLTGMSTGGDQNCTWFRTNQLREDSDDLELDEFSRSLLMVRPLRARFYECDTREMYFLDVNWLMVSDRLVLQDELDIRSGQPKQWEIVAAAYRRLIENFERTRSYDLAEDYFVGAMEMKRLDPKQPRGVRLVTTLYKFASEYGSNYIRALKVLGVLLLVFGILYALPWSGLEPVEAVEEVFVRPRIRAALHLMNAFFYSLDVATFQRVAAYKTTASFGHAVRILETFLVPGQLALLFLALRRRFRR